MFLIQKYRKKPEQRIRLYKARTNIQADCLNHILVADTGDRDYINEL